VPVDSGNGRSTIANAATNLFQETESIRFSSHTHRLLEFKPKGTVDSIYRMDMEIQDKATYTNEFQGIIGIVADTLMTHLNDTVGEKFFDLTQRIIKKAMLIVFVPANANVRQIELIGNKLGIGTKVFDAIGYDTEYLSRLFYDVSAGYASPKLVGYEECKERIASYIESGVREKTLKTVKKSAEALLYNDKELFAIYDVPEKTEKRRVF
jgi:hypothetical protein